MATTTEKGACWGARVSGFCEGKTQSQAAAKGCVPEPLLFSGCVPDWRCLQLPAQAPLPSPGSRLSPEAANYAESQGLSGRPLQLRA